MANVISKMYCMFDRAGQVFSNPFPSTHSGAAIRGFSDAINDPKRDTDISRHPDDFDLFEIAEYDSSTGIITPLPFSLAQPLAQGKQLALQQSLPFPKVSDSL